MGKKKNKPIESKDTKVEVVVTGEYGFGKAVLLVVNGKK